MDESKEENVHPATLEEQQPAFLRNAYNAVSSFMVNYGWFLIIGVLLFTYLVATILPVYRKWRKERDDKSMDMEAKRNPDKYAKRQEALEAARRKMQAEHDKRAQWEVDKRIMREEIRREDWLSRQGVNLSSAGYRLDSTVGPSPTAGGSKKRREASSKPDYNPLAGSGGSGGYRPNRRSCPGGGCG